MYVFAGCLTEQVHAEDLKLIKYGSYLKTFRGLQLRKFFILFRGCR
uniref:Uncharacterized protein n=1 Tax=Parascaris equorum TaxID=6256 RepID=A0A914RGP5_PAREQ